MSPKIVEAKPIRDYRLLLKFATNEQRVFDVKPYLEYEAFKPLSDPNEFKNLYIDFGTVCWKCGADLSRDTLYLKSYDYSEGVLAEH